MSTDRGERDATLPMPAWRVPPGPTGPEGLTEQEAARRLAARGGEPEPPQTSRSTASIVRANTLTVFNLILVVFGVLTLIAGDWRDALFLVILIGNSGIGILQELRSKRALDRLAALVTPSARVVRDGRERRIRVGQVVPGDLIAVSAGDQLVADGTVRSAEALALDESVLTGESVAVPRAPGEAVRAGSFVAEGSGTYVAEAVGEDSYAQKVAGEAREFRHPLSPLQLQVNRLLMVLVGVMVPLGISFAVVLIRQDKGWRESVAEATAGVVTLVPEGLILLVSLAYAVSTLRMSRRGALAQQISAIESLSATDVLCLDKTGTLTEDALRVVDVVPAADVDRDDLELVVAAYGAASGENDPMLAAMAASREVEAAPAEETVAFSSRRMWSGQRLGGRALVLGAPDVVLRGIDAPDLRERIAVEQAEGRRVLAMAESPAGLGAPGPADPPPAGLRPLGLVVLAERLREGVSDAIAFLIREGVRPVVISGDDPATVRAIARDSGIPVGEAPLDGRSLPADRATLAAAVLEAGVVGRTPPEEKRRIVEALGAGNDVAMMGDGVNDVPALKAARVAVCPGTAADMARTVADLVLVRGGFTSVPPMIGEGRTVLRNLQRVAKLFVAKSVLAAFLILTIGLSPTAYPFLPRHLTLISALTVGIPAFLLALAPSEGAWRSDRFIRDVARFAVPAGVAAGLGVVASFLISLNVLQLGLDESRTVAVTTLIVIGLHLVLLLEAAGAGPRRVRWTAVLCGAMLLAYVVVLARPAWREFFALEVPGALSMIAVVVGAGLAIGGLWATDERFAPPSRRLRAWLSRYA